MNLHRAYLLGRLANGAERDRGLLVHLVPDPGGPDHTRGNRSKQALCGAKPGRRSVGWSHWNTNLDPGPATCPRCLKRNGGAA